MCHLAARGLVQLDDGRDDVDKLLLDLAWLGIGLGFGFGLRLGLGLGLG